MQPAYQVLSRRQQGSPRLCIFVFDQVKGIEEPPKDIQLILMDQILGLAIRFWNLLFSKYSVHLCRLDRADERNRTVDTIPSEYCIEMPQRLAT